MDYWPDEIYIVKYRTTEGEGAVWRGYDQELQEHYHILHTAWDFIAVDIDDDREEEFFVHNSTYAFLADRTDNETLELYFGGIIADRANVTIVDNYIFCLSNETIYIYDNELNYINSIRVPGAKYLMKEPSPSGKVVCIGDNGAYYEVWLNGATKKNIDAGWSYAYDEDHIVLYRFDRVIEIYPNYTRITILENSYEKVIPLTEGFLGVRSDERGDIYYRAF